MTALEVASGMREPVEHFDQLALLERAALGAHAGEPIGVCDRAHAESLRLRAEEPGPAPRVGLWRRRAAEREHEASVDAWHEALDALEAETEAALARWRASCAPGLVEAATADRDAAIRSLADRDLFDRTLAEGSCAEPLGTMMVRSALAHD